MSLRRSEEQALESISDRLGGADPRLAGLLAIFSQLAAGERMPSHESVRRCRWLRARGLRLGQRLGQRLGLRRRRAR